MYSRSSTSREIPGGERFFQLHRHFCGRNQVEKTVSRISDDSSGSIAGIKQQYHLAGGAVFDNGRGEALRPAREAGQQRDKTSGKRR
jgi:hypothetical protein